MMMEPTETESKQTLDVFADVLKTIVNESAETLEHAPPSTVRRRMK